MPKTSALHSSRQYPPAVMAMMEADARSRERRQVEAAERAEEHRAKQERDAAVMRQTIEAFVRR